MQGWFASHYDVLKDFTTPVLTLVGFVITTCLGVAGLRSFNRWRREQIEEKKIEIAFEALNIAYKTKHVFDHIRSPLVYEHEWEDMPLMTGDTDDKRRRRGSLFAMLAGHLADPPLNPDPTLIYGSSSEQIWLQPKGRCQSKETV